jgi:hypothetical protein
MPDLLAGAEPEITLEQQILCVEREIRIRENVYPRWVESGKMKMGEADREIAVMRKVLETLRQVDMVLNSTTLDSTPVGGQSL